MNNFTDQELLRDFAECRSEAAFTELVRRHIDLVHSAAFRMTHEAHSAQDVTQAVFVALVQNAAHLHQHPVLSGWLHTTARNLAAKNVRAAVRRQNHEQEAVAMNELLSTDSDTSWREIAPHLDSALGELSESERDAVMLRYFERKSAVEMAAALGISGEAAQKRVSRAVERLREFFTKRGVTVGASGLVVIISANAVQAAPVGLALTISASALAGTAAITSTIIASTTKAIAMTALQKTCITIAVVGSVTTSLLLQSHYQAEARATDLRLQQQTRQLDQLRTDNGRLSNLVTLSGSPINNPDELQRLRAEAAGLRQKTNGLAALKTNRWELNSALAKARQDSHDPNVQPSEWSEVAKAKGQYVGQLGQTLQEFAAQHQGRFPTNFDEAAAFLPARTGTVTGFTPDQFEIVYQGSTDSLAKYANPGLIFLAREKQPWKNADGKWTKMYLTVHGIELISLADGDFESFEKKHILPSESSKP